MVEDEMDFSCAHDEAYKERDPAKVAEDLGLNLVESASDLLLCDLDTPESVKVFWDRFGDLEEIPDLIKGKPLLTISKSGKKHGYVRLARELNELERIGLQAVLGSDTKREALSVQRSIGKTRDGASVLFETDEEINRVRAFIRPATDF